MSCYEPIRGWLAKTRNKETRKRSVVFKANEALIDKPITIPCGQCIGCRLDKSREWATRCVLESQLHPENSFITLTFNDLSLNENRSLDKADFKKFMKRLRKKMISYHKKTRIPGTNKWKQSTIKNHYPVGHQIRYFHCGEYGDGLDRPHHHAALFNLQFPDEKYYKTKKGVKLYRSEILEKLWSRKVEDHEKEQIMDFNNSLLVTGRESIIFKKYDFKEKKEVLYVKLGFCTIGEVNYKSAAYIARYVMKKWSKDKLKGEDLYEAMRNSEDYKKNHYKGKTEEYITMSRRPAIGKEWYEKHYKSDVYNKDYFHVKNGIKLIKARPPKYFDKLYEVDNEQNMRILKGKRIQRAKKDPNNRADRLAVSGQVKLKQIKKLRRGYET